MTPGFRLPPLAQVVFVIVSCAVAVLLTSQVGGEREFLVLALVAAVVVVALSLAAPAWVLGIGGVLVFAAGYSVAGIPLPEVGALLIVIGSLMSREIQWRVPSILVFAVPLFLSWVVFVGLGSLSDPAASKRLMSIVLWLLLVVVLSLPSTNQRIITRGLLVGLLVSVPASLVIGSTYGDRGAGLVGDPNAFAMVVVLTTPLIWGGLELTRWQAVGVWGVAATAVVTADSRTGMASLAVATVVYLLLPSLQAWALGIPLIATFVSAKIPDQVVTGGRWEDRGGSDQLRDRIDAASDRQIADSPWTGHGLGSGKVDLGIYGEPPQDMVFFLHNSYKALVTEFGVVSLGLYAVIALGAVWHALRGSLNRGALAALAGALVMASHLGEVLLAIPMALALGFAWGSPLTSSIDASARRDDLARSDSQPSDAAVATR